MKQYLEKYYTLFGGDNKVVVFIFFDENNKKNMRKVFTIPATTTFEELKDILRKNFPLDRDFYIQIDSPKIKNNLHAIDNIITNMNQIINREKYQITLI